MPKKPIEAEALSADAPMLALIETPGVPEPTPVDQARIILLDPQKFDQFYDKVKGQTDAHVPDISTAAGRAEIKALAFRVTKTHTALKAASLELTEEARKLVATVNAARGPMIERLTNLAIEVRKPVTEWEEAEAARVEANDATLQEIRDAAKVAEDDTSETVVARGREIWARKFEAPQWTEEEAGHAEAAKGATVQALVAARDVLAKKEADAAELAQLRKEREERAAREAEETAKREAAEAAKREVERLAEVERQRVADLEAAAKAEADRIAAAEEEAADKARRDAEQKAADEQAERQREHDEALAKERAERERLERGRIILAYIREVAAGRIGGQVQPFGVLLRELEIKIPVTPEEYGDMCAEIEQAKADATTSLNEAMERQAERRRVEEEREAESLRRAEEQERAENKNHRRAIMSEVKEDLMTFGLDEETARKVVTGIVAKTVRHTTVAF